MLDASSSAYKRLRRLAGKGDVQGVRTALQIWPDRDDVAALAFRLGKWSVDNNWSTMLAVALEPEHGADFNQYLEKSYDLFLSHVVSLHRPVLLEMVLKAGVSPNAEGGQCNHPLLVASRANDVESARLLLEYGADPDGQHKGSLPKGGAWHRHTPLAEARTTAMAQLLLERGASPGARVPGGDTALVRIRYCDPAIQEAVLRGWLASGTSLDALSEKEPYEVPETALEWTFTNAMVNPKHPHHDMHGRADRTTMKACIHDFQVLLYTHGASLDRIAADGRPLWDWVPETGGPGIQKVLLEKSLPHPSSAPSRPRM